MNCVGDGASILDQTETALAERMARDVREWTSRRSCAMAST